VFALDVALLEILRITLERKREAILGKFDVS